MIARTWLIAILALASCVRYGGKAIAIDPRQVSPEAGWVMAAPTPLVRQRSLRDCGAAALTMVAARWGVTIAPGDRALPAPDEQGLRLGALRTAAHAHGLRAHAIRATRATLEYELAAGRPVIVGLLRPTSRRRATSHYEVVVAARGDQVVTLDPASGWLVRTWPDLEAEWTPAKSPALIVLGP